MGSQKVMLILTTLIVLIGPRPQNNGLILLPHTPLLSTEEYVTLVK